jgi:hypothetical protein
MAGDAPVLADVEVVALAHGGAVFAHPLDPDSDSRGIDRRVPFDDSSGPRKHAPNARSRLSIAFALTRRP